MNYRIRTFLRRQMRNGQTQAESSKIDSHWGADTWIPKLTVLVTPLAQWHWVRWECGRITLGNMVVSEWQSVSIRHIAALASPLPLCTRDVRGCTTESLPLCCSGQQRSR